MTDSGTPAAPSPPLPAATGSNNNSNSSSVPTELLAQLQLGSAAPKAAAGALSQHTDSSPSDDRDDLSDLLAQQQAMLDRIQQQNARTAQKIVSTGAGNAATRAPPQRRHQRSQAVAPQTDTKYQSSNGFDMLGYMGGGDDDGGSDDDSDDEWHAVRLLLAPGPAGTGCSALLQQLRFVPPAL